MSEQDDNANQELVEIQSLLKQLPEELLASVLAEKIQQEQSPVVRAVSQQFAGPLPPPQMLAGYEMVQAGFAERIVAMAEKEQAHRQSIEKQALTSDITIQKRGQWSALFLSLLILGGSMFLIYSDKEVAGSLLAGTTLTGLAYIFITGRKSEGAPEKKISPEAPH